MSAYNTNLAAEFHVLSMLYRLGLDATLTLGNKKSVDIIVVNKSGVLTIDVKGIAGTTLWPTDNLKTSKEHHFIIFVTFLGKINDYSVLPEVYIVPSESLSPLIYHNPNQTRQGVRLGTIRTKGKEFRDAWHLLDDRLR